MKQACMGKWVTILCRDLRCDCIHFPQNVHLLAVAKASSTHFFQQYTCKEGEPIENFVFIFFKAESLFTNIFYVGCSQPTNETRLAFINFVSGYDLVCIGRYSKAHKKTDIINCIHEETSKLQVFMEQNNIGTKENYLSMIKWIFKNPYNY